MTDEEPNVADEAESPTTAEAEEGVEAQPDDGRISTD
jgi:hypothetical protein